MSYPITFEVENKLVVVVGGGRVSTRRVARLLAAGARVTIVAPSVTDDLRELAKLGQVQWQQRGYRAGDLDGASLVLATTDDTAVNRRVANTAKRASIPVNVADGHSDGDFAIPALAEFGPLRLAIDTDGAGPAVSAALRRHLEQTLSPGWARGTEIAARLRRPLKDKSKPEQRARFWRAFADGLPEKPMGDDADVKSWLEAIAEDAGIELPNIDLLSTD